MFSIIREINGYYLICGTYDSAREAYAEAEATDARHAALGWVLAPYRVRMN